MVEVCIIPGLLGACTWGVQSYVIWGFVFFILGLLMASFIPLPQGKKMGFGLTILGLIMMVAFPMIVNAWNNNVGFQIVVYSVLVFGAVMVILFPKAKEVTGVNK